MRLADTVQVGALIRCPVRGCGNILGEEVAGVAVVRHRERKMVALAVSCGKRSRSAPGGCAGTWIAPGYVDLVRTVVRAVPTVEVA